MNRLALIATTTALLGVPAAAQAATGVVLSSDGHAHRLQVVDRSHHMHSVRYHGRVARLRPGARISYDGASVARRLRVIGHGSATVSFVARVVKSGRSGLVLATQSGQRVNFRSSQVRRVRKLRRHSHATSHKRPLAVAAAGDVTINIVGLQPGETVVVTESVDSSGNVTVTITLPQPPSSGGGDSGGGHSDPSPQDVVGRITAVSPDGLTVDTGSGSQTFTVDDPSITDGFSVGDQVDVSYEDFGGGNLAAIDVEWVESDLTGTVTAVDSGSLTVAPTAGGQPVTFTADPASGTFGGISVGDSVDVTYHSEGGHIVVDNAGDSSGTSGAD